MPSDKEPTWDTPAHMDGLPVTNWKKRTGYSMSGTVADLIQRWLSLPFNIQQECSLSWGPNATNQCGALSGSGIGSYVLRHGLPPKMAAARRRPATPEEIEAMFAKGVWCKITLGTLTNEGRYCLGQESSNTT